jgi:outer membrane protein assembly factor BamB
MKNSFGSAFLLYFILVLSSVFIITGCKSDTTTPNNNNTNITPCWIYNTQEIPYGSKIWLVGTKLIVCSRDNSKDAGTVHCIDASTGTSIWKKTDTTVSVTSPVVYDQSVIYGGYNVHALALSDGSFKWHYQNEDLHPALYSSPLLDGSDVYLGGNLYFHKLNANTGNLTWKFHDIISQNVGMAVPVLDNGKIYFGNILGDVVCLDALSGLKDWHFTLQGTIANSIVIMGNTLFAGIIPNDTTVHSFYSYKLDNQTLNWSVNIGIITSTPTVVSDKIYVTGNYTFYCLSTAGGSVIWKYVMTAGSISQPVISGDKVIVGNGDQILCLNATTGALIWKYATTDKKGFSTPTINGDRVYAACDDGKVYCFSL